MQLTNRAKKIEHQPLTFIENTYLPAIFGGMATTFKHLFKKEVTLRYPDVKRQVSSVYRGVHILKKDENGAERCTACGLCAVACPAEAITMEGAERLPNEEHLYREEKYAAKYEINMLRCIFCGLCEEACPKDAIYLSETFAPANYTRKGFIYGKTDLLIPNPKTEATALAMAKGEA
jgi:NADH-quinone oxidoreductase subunit I